MAQKKPLRKQRLIFSHGIGYETPFQTIHANPVTDQLTDVNDKGISVLAFSATWFVKGNWGIELLLQGVAADDKRRHKIFNDQMDARWGNQYYYNPYYFYQSGSLSRFTGALGLNYKIETKRFTYIPKFFVGIVSIHTPFSYNHYLKEKNTNTLLKLDYYAEKISREPLLLGTAGSVTYRLNSIIGVGLNASFFWHKAKMVYEEKLTNIFTNELTRNQYEYNQGMQRLNIGAHVSIGFGRKYDLVGEK